MHFEGNYFNTTSDQLVDLNLYLKIDEKVGTVSGFYHDRQIEYEVFGFVESDKKQIIIGLIKRPFLVIVGQYHPKLAKIAGYLMDEYSMDEPNDWYETNLVMR